MAKPSSGALNTLAMVAAFLVIGGFLYWLAVASEPTQLAVAEEGEQPQPISMVAFGGNPVGYAGMLVELEAVTVQETLGTEAFLFGLTDGAPYLVRISDAPGTASVPQVVPGDVVLITGRVEMMADSVLAAWDAEGVFTDPAYRTTVESFQSFIEAGTLQLQEPVGAAEPDSTVDSLPPGQN
ncbi:MAG: hypothetical protein WD056_01830 [Gemmatimonadota bacterium]